MAIIRKTLILIYCLCFISFLQAQSLTLQTEGSVSYTIFENGDRIPDFSYCGYHASEEALPFIGAVIKVPVVRGDATGPIQQAIDHVSSLPLNKDGFRGAVLLEKGEYEVEGTLYIRTSGVVLRGAGADEEGTVLKATGTDRASLIRIMGEDDCRMEEKISLSDEYIPVNATILPLSQGHGLQPGDRIFITRPSTPEWLVAIGADRIGAYVDYPLTHWEPGDFDLRWDRTVKEMTATSVILDAPITCSLDPQYGGGMIHRYSWPGRISHVAIENLLCLSTYDTNYPKDEEHRWMAITVENAEEGWIRRVTAKNFVSSAVALWASTRAFTVEDCKSLEPVGEAGAHRRYAFHTTGQQHLFQRCYAEYGWHDFSVGFSAAGPNAFVQCYSYRPYNFSGAIGGWSAGTLFDKVTVDGGALKIAYRGADAQGAGWSGVNSLCWQCRTPQLHIDNPPGGYNWAFGTWGQGYGDGYHEMHRSRLKPDSFYYGQLEERTGKSSPETDKIYKYESNPYNQVIPAYTAMMSERSKEPELIMNRWIDEMIRCYPLPEEKRNIKSIDKIKTPFHKIVIDSVTPQITIQNGVIVQREGIYLSGKTHRTALWRGDTRPSGIKSAKAHLSRFVPGREGRGLTDNLDTLTCDLLKSNVKTFYHFPALWYERRRDDHGRSRRIDADVWTPFYEQPFARTGEGEAFERLSKYDLNRFNSWYWMRLKKFATLADRNTLVFIQEHYLQHNIIEEGAHWTDYPWRSANNINEMDFAENTYYADDRRVFMAEEFYDISHPERARYHRQYIWKHLDELGDHSSVVHHLGAEYTGPLHFMKFWLDVIAEWQRETGKKVTVMLTGTKDIQDAILADQTYRDVIDIIDIRQWHYRTDGSLYAPEGGVSLAPRQYARIMEVGETDFNSIYKAVSEYRIQYPEKAVVYNAVRSPGYQWASFMAGGSLCDISLKEPTLLKVIPQMLPIPSLYREGIQWGMGKKDIGYLIYTVGEETVIDLLDDAGTYSLYRMDPESGNLREGLLELSGGISHRIKTRNKEVLWLTKPDTF